MKKRLSRIGALMLSFIMLLQIFLSNTLALPLFENDSLSAGDDGAYTEYAFFEEDGGVRQEAPDVLSITNAEISKRSRSTRPLSRTLGTGEYDEVHSGLPGTDPNVDYSIPPAQEPDTLDNTTVERIYVRWLTASDGAEDPAYFGLLDLQPETDAVKNQLFQCDFALSGHDPYAPYSIRIEIPAYLWHERDGETEPGYLTLAIPEDPDEGAEFVWIRDGDRIVIYNVKTIAAASKVMIQGTFRNVIPHEMFDNQLSNPISATITVATTSGAIVKQSNEIYAHLDTYIRAEVAEKTAYNTAKKAYDVWWDVKDPVSETGIPAALLANLDGNYSDYAFVRWTIAGTPYGNQPFDMYVHDEVELDGDEPLYGAVMLGASYALATDEHPDGVYPSPDGRAVDALLFSGYDLNPKTAWIWVAYLRSAFPEDTPVDLPNHQTISAIGKDDHVESTKTAEAAVPTKTPTEYTFIKYWDDNDNAAGFRPKDLTLNIYRSGYSDKYAWKTVTLTAADSTDPEGTEWPNHWTYKWSDEGKTDTFWVSEELNNNRGTFEEWFDGVQNTRSWAYYRSRADYDPVTHTYYYDNTYTEGWVESDLSWIKKGVEYTYSDPDLTSRRDNVSLNRLARDTASPILVRYSVSTSLSVSLPSMRGGYKKNRFVQEDTEYYLNGRDDLTVEDIDIDAVDLKTPIVWNYPEETRHPDRDWYKREQILPPTTYLYGMIDGKWEQLASMESIKPDNVNLPGTGVMSTGVLLTPVITPIYPGVTVTAGTTEGINSRVNLPCGVTGVKLVLESDEAEIVQFDYYVYLHVKPSEKVLEMLADAYKESDYIRFDLYNRTHSYAEYIGDEEPEGAQYPEMSVGTTGYLHGRQYRVATKLDKEFTLLKNDVSNRRLLLTSKLTLRQQSNVISKGGAEANDLFGVMELLGAIDAGELPITRSGVYYDLLPIGVEPVLESIELDPGDKLIDAYVVENYEGSGRNLLVVLAEMPIQVFGRRIPYKNENSDPPEGVNSNWPVEGYYLIHNVTFDSYIGWDSLLNSNLSLDDLYNTAAYEADEGVIGSVPGWSGEPDDPRGGGNITSMPGVGNDADLMTDLNKKNNPSPDDPDGTEPPAFVYAGAKLKHEGIELSALTTLQKHVSVTGTGLWTSGLRNNVNVPEGGAYSYRLTVTSAPDTTTRDIILLDTLENYVPNKDDGNNFGDNQWHGTLSSIDLSEVILAGVKPVVYYSTAENLDLAKYNANKETGVVLDRLKADDGVWSTDIPEGGLAAVKAIAFDLSKAEDGSDFLLKPNDAISIYLNMRAPFEKDTEHPDYFKDNENNFEDTDGTDPFKNAHAYNNIYLDCQQSFLGELTHDYIHNDYTKVGIYTRIIEVEKFWNDADDADGKRPRGLRVRLLADGVPVEGKEVILDETTDWKGTFSRMPIYDEETGDRIIYTFAELVFDADYKYNFDDEYEMSVNKRLVSPEDNIPEGVVYFELTNTHEPEKISIPVTKLWENEELPFTRPDSVTVRLLANGVFTGQTLTLRQDNNGVWYGEFTDLDRYYNHGNEIEYTLEEVPVADYRSGATTFEKVEDEDGNVSYVFTLTNIYHPTGDLIVRKLTRNTLSEASKEALFTFHLRLDPMDGSGMITERYPYKVCNEDGTPTGETGLIGHGDTFTLKGGQYIVIEDIPTRVKYTVSEEISKAFEQSGVTGETGEIISWQAAEAEFTNDYITKGSVQFKAWKQLTGRDLKALQFRFELTDEEGVPVHGAYNDGDGKVSFRQINYTNADLDENGNATRYYTITEYPANAPGYTYDSAVYTVKVDLSDNGDGTIRCVVTYYKGGIGGEPVTFTVDGEPTPPFKNAYHAEGSLPFRAWKVLDVRSVEDKEFDFILYDENFVPIDRASNNESGVVDFSPIAYNETHAGKTYWYYLRETAGDEPDPSVVYTEAILGYRVTVVDNGNGTLSFEQTAHDLTELFTLCDVCNGAGCTSCSGFGCTADFTAAAEVGCSDCGGKGEIEIKDKDSGEITVTGCETCGGEGKVTRPVRDTLPIITPVLTNELVDGKLAVSKYTDNGDTTQEFRFHVKLSGDKVEDGEYDFCIIGAEPRDFPSRDSRGNEDLQKLAPDPLEALPDLTSNVSLTADGSEILYSGTSGNGSVTWEIDDTYTLHVYPTNGESGMFTALNTIQRTTSGIAIEWQPYRSQILSIVIEDGVKVNTTANGIFYNLQNCTSITGAEKLDLSSAVKIPALFSSSRKLEKLNLSGWDVSGVTTANNLFSECSSLVELDLSGWNTASMTSVDNMFKGCSSLERVTLGDNFFASNQVILLPTPPDSKTTGKWMLEGQLDMEGAEAYSPEELRDGFRNLSLGAGTYVWQYKTYKVHFDPDDASGAMPTEKVVASREYVIPQNRFTRPGNKFVGWQVKGTETIYPYDPTTYTAKIPENTYADGDEITLVPVWEPADTHFTIVDGEFDFVLHGGEKAIFEHIPAGTAYQIWENTPDGWVLIAQEGTSGVIRPFVGPSDESNAAFFNLYQPDMTAATIIGTKLLDNRPSDSDANGTPFVFE
ncbi:MAG: Cna B-type domain-containing protein, partial [Oscillospiraceae bacterium]|nr:Cna B-type domain-containing protein [Oscillospiraceae bacterium]